MQRSNFFEINCSFQGKEGKKMNSHLSELFTLVILFHPDKPISLIINLLTIYQHIGSFVFLSFGRIILTGLFYKTKMPMAKFSTYIKNNEKLYQFQKSLSCQTRALQNF